MKEVLKRIIAILVLMMMLINSSLLLIISNAVEAIEGLIDENKIDVLHEIELEKYVNYSTEKEKGLLTQFNLKTGIEYEVVEEYVPLSSTGILLNLPKIENEYPENVEVIGKSTKATNGSNTAKDFKFEYNKENGELKIVAVNQEDESGNIYTENVNGARDEYTIICYYSSNCYDDKNAERNIEVSGFVQANIANESETTKKSEFTQSYEVSENISGLISTKIQTTDIYNGYINSNSKNETNYRTKYIENLEIDIAIKELADEINLSTNHSFIDIEDNVLDTNDIIYKSTKVIKNDVLNILGEDGFLQILNENGDVLGTLNKDTEVGDNDVYEVVYEDDLSNIVIKTSKPLKIGTILLQNTKEIKENVTDIEINKIKTEDNISCINNIQIESESEEDFEIEQKEIYAFTSENNIQIKNSETKIELLIDDSNWTNNVQNEVQFNVKLIANSIDCKLFENPVIEIKLPSEIEKVILDNTSLLYANGLNLENVEVVEDEDNKIIKVQLSGKQNEYYNTDMIEGAELVIPATIILKKDIASTETKIQLNCLNNRERVNLEKDIDIISINRQDDNENIQVFTMDNIKQISEDGEIGLLSEITATLGENILEDGQEIHEHEYIRYNIKLKNDSNSKIENINVIGDVPEGMTYVNCYFGEFSAEENDWFRTEKDTTITEYNETISLEVGEEKYLYYWTIVNALEDGETEKRVENNIVINIDGTTVNQENIIHKIKKAEMSLKINSRETYREDNLWIYNLVVTNNTDNVINNIVINMDLSDEMKFKYFELTGYTVSETVDGLKIDLPVLEVNETKYMDIYVQMFQKDSGEINFETQMFFTAKGDDTDIYCSNLNREKVYTARLDVVQTSEKEGQELQYDEEVEFDFVIRNVSNQNAKRKILSAEIINYMDKNLVPLTVEYEQFEYNEETQEWQKSGIITKNISNKYVPDGVDESTVSDVYIVISIPKGEEIHLKLKAKAGEVNERTETSNCLKLVYEYCGEHIVTSNIIKNVILPRYTEENKPGEGEDKPDEEKPGENDNPGEEGDKPEGDKPEGDKPEGDKPEIGGDEAEKKYYISGFAWEDKNKNGKYDKDTELKLENIIVKLFNAESNSIVKDENGNNLSIVTNANGEYIFNNIGKGKYLVLFEYDNTSYTLTTYKKDLILENENSDVIKKSVSIDGIEKEVALTDIIELDGNKGYINIGLIKNEKFDMSLNKSISNVTLKYNGYNNTFEYDGTKLAKVDVPAKKIEGAVIEVEYKIEVKNEGEVNGYVDEIIDYLPEGFSFDSELNKDWSQVSNGMLKNVANAGVIIKPGESKIVKIYLTKTLTSETVGTFVNYAEILKSSSINGDVDIDSVEGNRNQDEDDYSKAELIISIKTGAVEYAGMIVLLIAIIIVLKMLIDKNIINIKKIRIFSIIFLFICVAILTKFSYAEEIFGVEEEQIDILLSAETETGTEEVTEEDPNLTIAEFKLADAKDYIVEQVEETNKGVFHSCYDSRIMYSECNAPVYTGEQKKYHYEGGQRSEVHQIEAGTKTETTYYIIHSTLDGDTKSEEISEDTYKEYQDSISEGVLQHICEDSEHDIDECKLDTKTETKQLYEDCCYYKYYYTCNGYVTHDHAEEANDGELYCTEGGSMALYPNSATYRYNRVDNITVSNFLEKSRSGVATISSSSSPEYVGCPDSDGDSDYYLVGPYCITYEGELRRWTILSNYR